MKKMAYITLSILVSTPLLTVNSITADANNLPEPAIEKPANKLVQEQAHPHFSWGNPGPSSPVLHPGSIRGAGMVAKPIHEIDAVINRMIDNDVMPGAVTFVARRGHIVQNNAYGYAALYKNDSNETMDNPIKMSEDTIFDIASLSKIFTTIAAMELYEEGKFQLNDPVAKYIPEFAQNGKEDVTIQQLMTHTSGFKPWVPLYTIGESREDRLQYVFQYPLENEPGTAYTYSDLNMITLGALVERISGKRLDEFVHEHITGPLHMTDTMYNPPKSLKNRIAATEYQPWTNRGLVWGEVHDENAWSLDGVAGHAGVFSTAKDLAILGQMILNDGRYAGERILKPKTVELLVKNQIPEFPGNEHGLGWEISQSWYMDALSGVSTIGHTGFTGTSIVINQNNETIAILLTNRVHPTRETVSTNPARRQFARKVADAIPVSIDSKDGAWFAGYGGNTNKKLTAKVDIKEDTTLSFDTWFRTENGYDLGFIEVSSDGKNWTKAGETITGNSNDWETRNVNIPAGTNYIRFRYMTDTNTNGRGWYVTNFTLENGTSPEFTSENWVKRKY
ncbi:serine hydrolase domain-containing protein [Virgibacillus siamensis]|uniref:serine hydrolase domain-containing protein n=1 Tax=Virgibacillus siamensis TaxID=480071 RepID=UPI0009875BE3|nr:serine hydrolase domain-containing protein [Virgibacillus siamensis]